MHIKSIVAGATLALALTAGTASAADLFVTLDGVTAQPLIAQELDQVRGATGFELNVPIPGTPAAVGAAITVAEASAGVSAGDRHIAPPN